MTRSPAVSVASPPPVDRRFDRAFYTGMAIAIAAAVFVGFAPTFYLRPYFHPSPLALVFQFHGFVFTGWIVLFVVQTSLIASRHIVWHRRLGWLGGGLAVLMVAIGVTAALTTLRRDYPASGDEALTFFTTPVSAMAVFLLLAGLAIRYRRRPEAHKRLMLVATVSLLDAAVARWPLAIVGTSDLAPILLTDLYILIGIGYDLAARRRVHPAYLWGGLLVAAVQLLRDVAGRTQAWQSFARLLAG